MKKFVMPRSFKIGHAELDFQHEELVRIINLMIKNYDSDNFSNFMKNLKKFYDNLKTHFQYEDLIMQKIKGVDFSNHQAVHEKNISQVEHMLETLADTKDMKGSLQDITDGLIIDMLRHDLKFSAHIDII